MVRLTADLIQNSLSYLNPLKERELDLRGAFRKGQMLHT
jgi:U2 small nuclear ribonucleoprotein A'